MDQSLRQHIIFLEQRVQTLRDQLTDSSRVAELLWVQTDLLIAELALARYRAALALEGKVASPTEGPSLERRASKTP